MEIKTSVEGTRATFEVEGKLTVQTAPDLEAAIDAAPAPPSERAHADRTVVSVAGSHAPAPGAARRQARFRACAFWLC